MIEKAVEQTFSELYTRGCSRRTATVPRSRRGKNRGYPRLPEVLYRRSRWSWARNGATRAKEKSWTCWRWTLTSFAGVRYVCVCVCLCMYPPPSADTSWTSMHFGSQHSRNRFSENFARTTPLLLVNLVIPYLFNIHSRRVQSALFRFLRDLSRETDTSEKIRLVTLSEKSRVCVPGNAEESSLKIFKERLFEILIRKTRKTLASTVLF